MTGGISTTQIAQRVRTMPSEQQEGIEREWRYVLHPKSTMGGRVFDTRNEAVGEQAKLNRRMDKDLEVTARELIPSPSRWSD